MNQTFLSKLKDWLAKRLPSTAQTFSVYGVIVLVVYGWTIYWYLWKLPSWLYFLTIGEMTVVLAYAVFINFLESLIVLGLLLLIACILPPAWLRDTFVSRGTAFVITLMYLLMRYLGTITAAQDIPKEMLYLAPLGLLILVAVSFIAGRIAIVRRILDEVASRASIFVYIFAPLSILSALVVLVRNLFA